MKNVLIFVGILIAIIVLAAVLWLAYMGMFSKVAVEETELGPFTFVYVEHKGDYSKAYPAMNSVSTTLEKDFGIKAGRGFAIYYDDPKTTKSEDLRSDQGVLLEGTDVKKAAAISSKLLVKRLNKKMYVVATFPMKNMLSYMLGPGKAYPALGAYMKEKGYLASPAIEIYGGEKIIYAFELKKG